MTVQIQNVVWWSTVKTGHVGSPKIIHRKCDNSNKAKKNKIRNKNEEIFLISFLFKFMNFWF